MKSSGVNIMLCNDFLPFGFILGLSSPFLCGFFFALNLSWCMELFFWDFALQAIVLQIRDTGIVGIEIETESPRLRIPGLIKIGRETSVELLATARETKGGEWSFKAVRDEYLSNARMQKCNGKEY